MATTGNTKHFDHKWVIKNWKAVILDETITDNTTIEIPLEADNFVYAKFLIGTSFDQQSRVGFYWKLLNKHHCIDTVQANLVMEILRRDGRVVYKFERQWVGEVGTKTEILKSFWGRECSDSIYDQYTNAEGSLEVLLKFTLQNLPDEVFLLKAEEEEFRKTSKDEFCQNFAALLDNKLGSDVKILTKDNIELAAHKAILSAQCTVFASMFQSDLMESSTGVVKVDDISAKTMKILLNYWYTGELLPSCRDDDTVVEFLYAAGKYQMTKVLKLMNGVIGYGSTACDKDVQLLKMTQNLSLETAEARLLKRVIHKITQSVSGKELLEMFYEQTEKLNEENFEAEKIVNAWNDAIGENGDTKVNSQDIKLMALACKLGSKNVEKQLLKRIVDAVTKVGSSDELFALFDVIIEENEPEGSKSTDLLVRASPN